MVVDIVCYYNFLLSISAIIMMIRFGEKVCFLVFMILLFYYRRYIVNIKECLMCYVYNYI